MARASIGALEEEYVLDALQSGWVSGNGPYVERFEHEWSLRCGTRHAVAVSSGTAALQLLLLAQGVAPGDEIVVPALTFAAVANAVRHTGAVPVVVDVDASTWCLSTAAIGAAITSRTVGVIAVHAYGHSADMNAIATIADHFGLWVMEDGAEAHFATYHGAPVGGLAAGAAFSFFGNKIITTGEGGAVTTDDDDLAETVRALRHHGIAAGDDRYSPSLVGLGLRMGNLAAAVGCAQLERAEHLLAERRAAVAHYEHELRHLDGISLQPVAPSVVAAPWLFSVLVDSHGDESARDTVARALAGDGIESRNLFPPLGTLAVGRARGHASPVATRLARDGLSLPLFAGIEERDICRIVETIRQTR
ncbi:MAG: perosamine synthetase [Actinomycetota bacterium]|nr:perosamine synthetase [Actinomycetota bacterium]